MNTTVLIVAGLLLGGLIVFLILRNKKDRKDFEQTENRNYKKPRNEEDDTNTEIYKQ